MHRCRKDTEQSVMLPSVSDFAVALERNATGSFLGNHCAFNASLL